MALDNRLLFIKYERGERILTTPKQEELSEENIIFILDEKNDAVWVWFGKNTSNLARRDAERLAHGLRSSGYPYGQQTVAPQAKNYFVLDQREFSDPSAQALYDRLLGTLTNAQMVDQYLANVPFDGRAPLKRAEINELQPHAEIPPEESSETIPPPPAPVVSPPPPVETTKPAKGTRSESSGKANAAGEVKAGILIYSVLKQFSELYLIKTGDEILVEGTAEPLSKFTIKENELTVSPEYKFSGKQDEVIKRFRDLLKLTKL